MKLSMLATLAALTLGCAEAGFQEGRLATIPDGIENRWTRFSADGRTVAYVGVADGRPHAIYVGDQRGPSYAVI
jgi:Tol biopolymer transport system component